MKRRLHPFMRRIFRIVVLPLLFLALTRGWIQAQVGREFVNFFSSNSTLFGAPVPPGAVVRAFDPDGVQCGEFTVIEAGKYGLMPCYRDDPTTTEDDGADPGDVISFTINGIPATPIPRTLNGTPVPAGTPATWTSNGDRWEVDLQVVATATPGGVAHPVGGYGEPPHVLELLLPWLGLLAFIVAGTVYAIRSNRDKTA